MRSSSFWPELVKIALMGTSRHAPSPKYIRTSQSVDSSHTQTEHILTQLDWTKPETAILNAASTIALHTQAGQIPHLPDFPPSRLAECKSRLTPPRPLCSPKTVKHLRHGLSHDVEFCAEVLSWLVMYQQCIPEEYLPALLDFGVRYSEWRSLILQVIGERGRWLASQNSEWGYGHWDWSLLPNDLSGPKDSNGKRLDPMPAAGENSKREQGESKIAELPEPFSQMWKNGSKDQRLELLEQWRAIAPNAARAFLQTIWPQESAKNRAVLLSGLSTGLQLADEPFLDHALSDRSSTVRAIAVQLIARLPNSQWCQRMTEWGRSLFTILPPSMDSPRLTSTPTPTNNPSPANISSLPRSATLQIQVTLPNDTTTFAMLPVSASQTSVADSKSSQKSTRKTSKQKTATTEAINTLMQIVGSMSLSFWDQYGTPDLLLQSMHNQQYGSAVIQGWALASIRQTHAQWASALLQDPQIVNNLNRSLLNYPSQETSIIIDLFHLLPHCQREEILTTWVPKSTRQQISLLANPHFANTSYQMTVEQGAANGEAMAKWLQLAVAIRTIQMSAQASSSTLVNSDRIAKRREKARVALTQQWSLEFSQLVLCQLQREISHQMQLYIQELRPLSKAIASRLDPALSDSPIFTELAERPIPGPSYLERSWDQSIDIIRSTLALRQSMQATFT